MKKTFMGISFLISFTALGSDIQTLKFNCQTITTDLEIQAKAAKDLFFNRDCSKESFKRIQGKYPVNFKLTLDLPDPLTYGDTGNSRFRYYHTSNFGPASIKLNGTNSIVDESPVAPNFGFTEMVGSTSMDISFENMNRVLNLPGPYKISERLLFYTEAGCNLDQIAEDEIFVHIDYHLILNRKGNLDIALLSSRGQRSVGVEFQCSPENPNQPLKL
jgi:hypothetical protein